MATPLLLLPKSLRLTPLAGSVGKSYHLALLSRQFHTSKLLRSDVNPDFPDEPNKVPRVRRPGRYFSEPLNSSFRIGNAPLYTAPAGSQVAFTKRSTLGFAALGAYVGYLCSITTGLSSYVTLLGMEKLLCQLL